MKGYTIQHSIELLEKEAGSGSGGASTAAEVSFDNTGTDLVATNVQSALGELDTSRDYSSTPVKIGKFLDQDLYRVVLSGTMDSNSKNLEFSSNNIIRAISGGVSAADGSSFLGMWYRGSQTSDIVQAYPDADTPNILVLRNGYYATRPNYAIVVDYTVATTTTNSTRKKSSK